MSLALDELLGLEEQRTLDGHLAACEPCAAIWGAMSEASAMMSGSRMTAPPAGFVQSVLGELETRQRRELQRRQGIAVIVSLVALLGTIALLSTVWLGGWWAGAVGLRVALGSFFEQIGAVASVLARGVRVPLQLLGPTQGRIAAISLALIVSGCAVLWASVLVRVDRHTRRAAGSPLQFEAMSFPR